MFVAWRLRGFAKVVCFWGDLRVGWVVVDLGLLVLLLFTGGVCCWWVGCLLLGRFVRLRLIVLVSLLYRFGVVVWLL